MRPETFIIGRPVTAAESADFFEHRTKLHKHGVVTKACEKTYGKEPHLPGDFGYLPGVSKQDLVRIGKYLPSSLFLEDEYKILDRLLVVGNRASIAATLPGRSRFANYGRTKALLAILIDVLERGRYDPDYTARLKHVCFDPKADVVNTGDACESQAVPMTQSKIRNREWEENWNQGPTPFINTGNLDQRVNTIRQVSPPPRKAFRLTEAEFNNLAQRVDPRLNRGDAQIGAYRKTVEGLSWGEIKESGLDAKAGQPFVHELEKLKQAEDDDLASNFE